MIIQELSRAECLRILATTRVARLACSHDDQPYVVPVYLTLDPEPVESPSLYGITTVGDKVQWMRANPKVCVEVDDLINFDQWVSIIVLGRFEELTEESSDENDRLLRERQPRADSVDPAHHRAEPSKRHRAFQILQQQPMWWEPASAAWSSRTGRKPGESYVPVYYRVVIEHLSGHQAQPDTSSTPATAETAKKASWIRSLLPFG